MFLEYTWLSTPTAKAPYCSVPFIVLPVLYAKGLFKLIPLLIINTMNKKKGGEYSPPVRVDLEA